MATRMRLARRFAGRIPGVVIVVTLAIVSPGGAGSLPFFARGDSLSIVTEELDWSEGPWIRSSCEEAIGSLEAFFGLPFAGPLRVRVFPDRAALTAYWRSAWGVPDLKTECWQVASGTASLLALLSPRTWKEEACDHDPADSNATRLLIAHELVHVFHAQRNPRPEFDGMDELSWFVEGLATYASGQLDRLHAKAARAAVEGGKGPSTLANAWSGKYRYGVAGSLVRFLDVRYGRAMLCRLLSATSQEEVLRAIGLREDAFLEQWRAWVLTHDGG